LLVLVVLVTLVVITLIVLVVVLCCSIVCRSIISASGIGDLLLEFSVDSLALSALDNGTGCF